MQGCHFKTRLKLCSTDVCATRLISCDFFRDFSSDLVSESLGAVTTCSVLLRFRWPEGLASSGRRELAGQC